MERRLSRLPSPRTERDKPNYYAHMSRQQYKPTDAQRREVLTMTGFGIRQADICKALNIDAKTLRLHFRRELDTGAVEANVRVAQSLYSMATREKNVAAAIWWTKARMGWRDTTVVENKGEVPRMVVMFGADAKPTAQVTFDAEPNDYADDEAG
jgi:hypothetical protein